MRGNDQRGLFFGVESFEQLDDFTTGMRIEIAGRFIGQEQFRLVDEGAGDGHALLLAAGKFGRPVLHAVLETNPGEQVASARPGLADGSAGHARRQTDIFERIEFRQQMIRLKNETDAVVAEKRQLTPGECGEILPGKMDFTRVGRVESADEMEQRAFAGTGRAAQSQEFTAQHLEIDAAQHFERALAHGVSLGEGAGGKQWLTHDRPPIGNGKTSNIEHPTLNIQ